jgi:hypothetical protein
VIKGALKEISDLKKAKNTLQNNDSEIKDFINCDCQHAHTNHVECISYKVWLQRDMYILKYP